MPGWAAYVTAFLRFRTTLTGQTNLISRATVKAANWLAFAIYACLILRATTWTTYLQASAINASLTGDVNAFQQALEKDEFTVQQDAVGFF